MKSVVLGNNRAYLEDVPDPVAKGEWVVVKIESTPICGSDRAAFLSDTPVRDQGHEGSGIVVSTNGSNLLKEGDRVIINPLSGCGECALCRSGNYIYCTNKPPFYSHFAEYVLVQDFVCTKLPDDISYDQGALGCCALGPAFSSIKRLNVKGFDTVLITGLGPVGMGAITISKFLGARVIALDSVPFRQNLAKEMGADVVLNPMDADIKEQIRKVVGDERLIKAVDASGNANAERLCIDMMDPGGSVAFIGENHNSLSICPSDDMIRKGLTLLGSWHYNMDDKEEMFAVLRHSPVAHKIITDVYGFSDVQGGFEKFMSQDTCKVILKPWE